MGTVGSSGVSPGCKKSVMGLQVCHWSIAPLACSGVHSSPFALLRKPVVSQKGYTWSMGGGQQVSQKRTVFRNSAGPVCL